MKIGILAAMAAERAQVASLLRAKDERGGVLTGYVGDKAVLLLETGIGKVNAAVGAMRLLALGADVLVSTGVAGGIDRRLRVMDAVVSTELAYHDVWCGPGNAQGQVQGLPPRFAADGRLVAIARSLPEGEGRLHAGLILTGDRFITSPAELHALKEAYPEALAVDMESAALAHVCHLRGVPFVSLRTISDTPGAEGHLQQYADFWGEMADRSFCLTRAFLAAL